MTKIDLLTGILGSGKTTLLLKYARHLIDSGENIAVLENDFGAVNIDMMMLQELKGEHCRLEMIAGGCDADCHRRRFKTQLISLGMQHLDRVIVEPSGIFDMDEFFDILHESPLDNWFEIGSVITVADSEMEEKLSPKMEYMLGSEAACCGKLVISKLQGEVDEVLIQSILDHVNRAMVDIRCDRRLTQRDVIAKDWKDFTSEDYKTLSCAGYRGTSYVKKFSPDEIGSSVHYFMHIALPQERIGEIITDIMSDDSCGRIFRIKGGLPATGGWLKINATREKTEISPVSEGQSVIIVIGENISRERIDEHLKRYNSDVEYVSI
ncbi:GTP-binding protein [Ruminococcus sp.]|uniref:GTP-binding protein n=1 Tax=Ruminococcus sp. TaxID=41978 RepID=UPI001B55CF51|nr:GTP-binding protein [Ruminococcus sp.]MBP5433084.1 GTPase (G3E family) [Ruminococcus sp.]